MPMLSGPDINRIGREAIRKRAVVLSRTWRNALAHVTNTEVSFYLGEVKEEAIRKAREQEARAREYLCEYVDLKGLAWSPFDPRAQDAQEALFDEEWDAAAEAIVPSRRG